MQQRVETSFRGPDIATYHVAAETHVLVTVPIAGNVVPADYGGQLPLVSQRSLEMAFHRAAQAVAVVQVASRTPVKPGSSDAACSHLEPVAEHPTGFHQATAYSRAASVRVSMLHSDDGGCPATGMLLHAVPHSTAADASAACIDQSPTTNAAIILNAWQEAQHRCVIMACSS